MIMPNAEHQLYDGSTKAGGLMAMTGPNFWTFYNFIILELLMSGVEAKANKDIRHIFIFEMDAVCFPAHSKLGLGL